MNRGGMRHGAGRPASHAKAEHRLQLDARRWAREGILCNVCSGGWTWTDAGTGEQQASINYYSDGETVMLAYVVSDEPVSQSVPILTTPCHYGGHRYWFGCPECGQQVALLYMRRERFGCRKCCHLAYACQSESSVGRAWRKQAKIERLLGEHWQRPKGMHQTTHERLLDMILACEEDRVLALAGFLRRHGLIDAPD